MHHAAIAVTICTLATSLVAGEPVDGAPGSASASDPAVLEEVLVEAMEPRYAAPTLRDRIGRVWAPVMINGKGPFRLVLDTGATTSAIVSSVAERLKLPISETAAVQLQGATGAAMVHYVTADQLEVGDLLIEGARLPIVADVFGGAEGVLGTQGLADKRIHIDFRRDLVEIEFAFEKLRSATPPLQFYTLRNRLAVLDLRVGGVRTKAIIDTGAQFTIGNNSLRDALLLRSRQSEDVEIIGVTLEIAAGQSIRAPPIRMGGVEVRNLRITFNDMSIFEHWALTDEPVLLIGMDVIGTLESFVIDYRRGEVYLRARG